MKKIAFQLALIWISIIPGKAQDLVRVYMGLNYSKVDKHIVFNAANIDSTAKDGDRYILPMIGVDVQFSLTKKSKLVTGLGVQWMGTKNYSPEFVTNINIDRDLRIGYLQIPITYQMAVLENMLVLGGISNNFSFRKNLVFYAVDTNGHSKNIYKPYHIGLLLGVRYDISKVSLQFNYHYGLTKVYDSGDFDPDHRFYGSLSSLQFSVGYLFTDED